jgi:dipeptidase E
LCWFDTGVTDSFGGPLTALDRALGILPGSFCPHYNGDARRRPTYRRLVGDGMAPGYAADVGAALHFIDGTLAEVVTSRPDVAAYRVERRQGGVDEQKLTSRYLGERASATF